MDLSDQKNRLSFCEYTKFVFCCIFPFFLLSLVTDLLWGHRVSMAILYTTIIWLIIGNIVYLSPRKAYTEMVKSAIKTVSLTTGYRFPTDIFAHDYKIAYEHNRKKSPHSVQEHPFLSDYFKMILDKLNPEYVACLFCMRYLNQKRQFSLFHDTIFTQLAAMLDCCEGSHLRSELITRFSLKLSKEERCDKTYFIEAYISEEVKPQLFCPTFNLGETKLYKSPELEELAIASWIDSLYLKLYDEAIMLHDREPL